MNISFLPISVLNINFISFNNRQKEAEEEKNDKKTNKKINLISILPYLFSAGFLGSFLSNSLKTNQLEVNTDAKTLRPIARLKEPRDLFALPKERDYDCPQQAPRWPTECQVNKNFYKKIT